MKTISHMLDDVSSLTTFALPNLTGKTLSMVIHYCTEHFRDPDFIDPILEDELFAFDKKFIKVNERTLYDLILAANYLDIKGLLNLTCQTVADMIKGKTPGEIRKKFNIKYDFSPEEEKKVKEESTWTFV